MIRVHSRVLYHQVYLLIVFCPQHYGITINHISTTITLINPILIFFKVEQQECQSLVLAPTRELAQQIVKVVRSLGDFMNIQVHACVGGTAVRDDIRTLQNGVHIVVGTPGRVYDMISRRALNLQRLEVYIPTLIVL